MRKLMFLTGLLLTGTVAYSQSEEEDHVRMVELQSVQVTSTRAADKTPMAHSTVGKEELGKSNIGVDLPFILTKTPSVVATSEAGAGIGYTGIRIRGSDPTRINVTLNGVPMNDGESHNVFWVNTPDIVASTEDIQLQRGVGTSTNGAGAFGGSINLRSEALSPNAYTEISGGYGSFNTHRESINIGTGLIGKKWGFNLRLSNIGTDGYVDRASVSLKSYFFQAGYYGKNTTLKFITFAGKEETYHAWNGITKDQIKKYGRRYNSCGEIKEVVRDADGKPVFDNYGTPKTKVVDFYDDQTDNYILSNYHLLFTQRLNNRLNLNVTLHYYKGDGYYEEYKNAQRFERYALESYIPAEPELEAYLEDGKVVASNLVRRKKMDNWFGGGIFSLDYNAPKIKASLGGAFNKYDGDHFGRVMWVQNYSSLSSLHPEHEYYDNRGEKLDFNIYAKASWKVAPKFYLYGDLQYRHINYKIGGINDKWDSTINNMQPIDVNNSYNFFNPKFGLTYDINSQMSIYGSFAVAHREPSRNNFTNAKTNKAPKDERLLDYELGYEYNGEFVYAGVNLYYMNYKDQLILTGEVNHIGEPLATNVPDSYRMGIELMAGAQLTEWLRWDVNATFSSNKIKNFVEYLGDESKPQYENKLGKTTIAYSPSVMFGSTISAQHKGWSLALQSNFVGKQYLTNSASALSKNDILGEYYDADDNRLKEDMSLDSYFVNNLRLGYTFKLPYTRSVDISLTINNIFNKKYFGNGGAGSYIIDNPEASNGKYDRYNYAWFFPQAGTNVMASIALKF